LLNFKALECPTQIHEVSRGGVVPIETVHVKWPNGSLRPVALMHTMFKIQPQQTECDWHMMSRGGVFLDATGKQYWFVPGLRRVEEYPFDIRPEYTKAQEVRDLGFEYREHLQDLNTPIDDGRDGEHDKCCSGYVNEVMVRTINHATHEAVSTSGGPKAFLNLDDASYVQSFHLSHHNKRQSIEFST
jgi:hypothetical protein